MMRPLRLLSACLLLSAIASLSGCRHKVPTLPVQQAQAPPLNASSITVITPLPTVPPSATPAVEPVSAPKPAPPPPAKVKKPRRHRRRSEAKETHPTTEVAAQSTSAAAAASTAAAAAEWSTGTALDPKQRNQMVLAIDAQEKRMGNLSASAKGQTAVLLQVKLFLEKARTAVVSNDLDGATTLTTKARVLLDELQGVEP
jgi:outer membrane biosynthesis protein TonB